MAAGSERTGRTKTQAEVRSNSIVNRSIRYHAIALCGVAASLLAHSVAYSHHGTAGRYFEDSDAQGINGPQDNDAAQEAGAVYLFTREGETWAQEAYVKGSNTETFDEFGSSVSISTAVLPIRRFISLRTRILPSSSKASSRRCSGARPTFAIGWRTRTERVGSSK